MIALLVVVLALLAAAPAAEARTATVPTVVRDVKTGRDTLGTRPLADGEDPIQDYVQPDTEIEPSIAVNPENPLNAVTAYQVGRIANGGDATNGFATTFDGGRTWISGYLPKLTKFPGQGGPFERASDAVVAFGPDNVVYANSLVFDEPKDGATGPSGIAMNVSKDGGRTWSDPVFFQNDQINNMNDKNWIVVDQSDAPGHHKGRVYAIWDQVAPVLYDYCDHDCDKQENWLPRLQTIPETVFPGQGIGAYPVVMKSGALGIALDTLTNGAPTGPEQAEVEPGTTDHVFIVAPNAGSTPYPAPLAFGPPVRIASNESAGQPAQRGTDGLPAATVDPKSGAVYVAWDDSRFRTDDPDPTNDAVLAKSTDEGTTWSAPIRVNPGPTDDHVDHYGVTVAAGTDGALHVAYRQRDESGKAPVFHPEINTYYQESRDGAKTFTTPLRLDRQPSLAPYGAFSRDGLFEGDYYEIASAKGSTYHVRCSGMRASPNEPPALTPAGDSKVALTEAGKGHQHQSCWVAVIRDLARIHVRLQRHRLRHHRVRLRLRGDVRQVRSVRYTIGRRVVARRKHRPFRVTLKLTKHRLGKKVVARVKLRDGRTLKLKRRLYRRRR